ncbi:MULTISPECIES: PhzF family phenazine biosynthesis protein [unclassified Cryobacterium]|uniref:PhzF family phenazine biosynthesis protein n=1 Tax=unclassified Cryobacterium TaxID=2649013 RepID=UPI000CE3AF69|nr:MULTISPECIES: PhzF family phenazine biosynthesis protein [unclassified Cryobacterium]
MTLPPSLLRLAAFAAEPGGGNPAGVLLDARNLDDGQMQDIATEVGYAETAFLTEPAIDGDQRHARIKYFSPLAEVPFCGHATIATAIALATRDGVGTLRFETAVGVIVITTTLNEGAIIASFTSVEPRLADFSDGVLDRLLDLLGIGRGDLDPQYAPQVAFAGNWHPILVFANQTTFDTFQFDVEPMASLIEEQNWTGTVTTLFALAPNIFAARNLFPVGTILEDPATGSAAAALGGYLRELALVDGPTRVLVHQGSHIGRPSLLTVDIPRTGGIIVSGSAITIT